MRKTPRAVSSRPAVPYLDVACLVSVARLSGEKTAVAMSRSGLQAIEGLPFLTLQTLAFL
jgi:hypothetical protein